MRPTFLGFETQKRTLQIAQKNLDITGNNLSNVNTPGYTRQRVDIRAEYISGNQNTRWCTNRNNMSLTGQGVAMNGVAQLRDIYVDKRYRENTAVECETEKTIEIMSEVEDVLDNIDSDGLQYFTEQFYKSLHDYSTERPDSSDVATITCNSAVNLCRLLNEYAAELNRVEDTYAGEMRDTVDYVNGLFEEINTLNDRIAKELINYPEGYGPNELYDQLNLYIDELADYGNIEVTKNTNGTYSIDMAGVQVVDGIGFKTNRLVMQDYEAYGQAVVKFESGEKLNCGSGILKSYFDTLNGNGVYATGDQNREYGIAYFKSALDEYARTLADTLNNTNGAAYDSSRLMFEAGDGSGLISAGNIHVTEKWIQDPTMIGQVRKIDPISGEEYYGWDEVTDELGNVTLQNSNVLYLISQFKNTETKFGNAHDFQGGFYDYIKFMSTRLAETISYEKSRYDTAVTAVDTLLDARDEVSGVNLDEEGINMLNYQKWYNASSRMLTTLDEALDKLINSTGRVGL